MAEPNKLTADQLESVTQQFSLFDANGDGSVDAKELGSVMRMLQQYPTQTELEEMIREMDSDGSGAVEFAEFCKIMAKVYARDQKEELGDALKLFESVDGVLTKSALIAALTEYGAKLEPAAAEALIAESNPPSNKEGVIDVSKFLDLIMAGRGKGEGSLV
jgi:Ca2+-binding EF-hand superfamily protein